MRDHTPKKIILCTKSSKDSKSKQRHKIPLYKHRKHLYKLANGFELEIPNGLRKLQSLKRKHLNIYLNHSSIVPQNQ